MLICLDMGRKLESVASREEEEQSQRETLGLGIVFKAQEIKELIINSTISLYRKTIGLGFQAMGSDEVRFSPEDEANMQSFFRAQLLKGSYFGRNLPAPARGMKIWNFAPAPPEKRNLFLSNPTPKTR